MMKSLIQIGGAWLLALLTNDEDFVEPDENFIGGKGCTGNDEDFTEGDDDFTEDDEDFT